MKFFNSVGCGCNKKIAIPVIQGTNGTNGTNGGVGANGFNGWSPQIAVVTADATSENAFGFRKIHKFVGWTGGTGTAPSSPIAPNLYLGSMGYTTVASATDLQVQAQLPDTGWQNMFFGTGFVNQYQALQGLIFPQYRVIGNQMFFRGGLVIPSATVGTSFETSGVAVNTTYVTTIGNNNAEALRFLAVSIPLGTTVAGVTLPSTFPTNAFFAKKTMYRYFQSSTSKRIFVQTETGAIYFDVNGKLNVSTIQDGEFSNTSNAIGTSTLRIESVNIVSGDYVLDYRTLKNSSTSPTTYPLSVDVLSGAGTHTQTCDSSDARKLGGFVIDLNNTFTYLT